MLDIQSSREKVNLWSKINHRSHTVVEKEISGKKSCRFDSCVWKSAKPDKLTFLRVQRETDG